MSPVIKLALGLGVSWAAIALLRFVIVTSVSGLQRKFGLVELSPARGRTTQSPEVAVIAVLSLLVGVGGAVGVALHLLEVTPGDEIWLNAMIATFCVFGLLFAMFQLHAWRWNEEGIEWRGVWRSVRIHWKDIKSARVKPWRHEFEIVGLRGERIVWTIMTLGVQALFDALLLYRPDRRDSVPFEQDGA